MPSWFQNLWTTNAWATEPERTAAQAPSLAGVIPPFVPLPIPEPLPPPKGPREDFTYETEDWFQSLSRPWPKVDPVIPIDKWVSAEMSDEVRAFVNRRLPADATPRMKLQCFDFANFQLARVKCRTGGRPSLDPRSLQILINYYENGKFIEEAQTPESIEAVMYMQEALQQGIPVLIGICLRKYKNRDGTLARPNNVASTPFIEPTNHFVVVVGMDADDKGSYFRYYDYAYRPDSELGESRKLYLQATMKLERLEGDIVMAEVRHTLPRPQGTG